MKKILFLFCLIAAPAIAQLSSALREVVDSEIFTVLPTGSMEPTFDEKSWLLVKHLPFSTIRVGDVILFKDGRIIGEGSKSTDIICHRVIRKSSGGGIVLTKGDANEFEDNSFITEDMYVGTVIAIVRKP